MKANRYRACYGVDLTAGCAQYPCHFPGGDTALSADETSPHNQHSDRALDPESGLPGCGH